MTAADTESEHRRAVLVLTIATATLWSVAVAAAAVVLVLMLRGEAPAPRIVVIVAGWFLTPAIPAMGATVGLIVVRRRLRARRIPPSSEAEGPSSRDR